MFFDWNTILAPGEILQKEFRLSQRYLQILLSTVIAGSILVCFANIFAGIVVFFSGSLYCFYMLKAKRYALTDKRILLVDAFLGTNITSVDYNQITDIEIEQSVIDQMGGWGTMAINSAGTHVPEIRLSFIDQPQMIKQKLDEIRDKQTASQGAAMTGENNQSQNGSVAVIMVTIIVAIAIIAGGIFWIHSQMVNRPVIQNQTTRQIEAEPTIKVTNFAQNVPDNQKTIVLVRHADSSEEKFILSTAIAADFVKRIPPGDIVVSQAPFGK